MTTETRARFLEEYRQIRYSEGRGSHDPAYYRALPYADLTGRNSGMWAMRAKTYRYFENRILKPLERVSGQSLKILDLGAGNCWMSHQLSLRQHHPYAVDIFLDPLDGLGAARHYPHPFPVIAAEFDRLPFAPSSFDLAVFNSAVHYSTDYEVSLREVARCLRPQGQVVILDSPIYRKREHGEQMVAERHQEFEKRYGFRSDAIASIEFLDEPALDALSRSLKLRWTVYRPWYGWRWHSRGLRARLHGSRPPSRFWILAGRFER